MRAGFLGQNICALGFGIATLQAPRLVMDEPVRESLAPVDEPPRERASRTCVQTGEKDTLSTDPVTNPQRLCM